MVIAAEMVAGTARTASWAMITQTGLHPENWHSSMRLDRFTRTPANSVPVWRRIAFGTENRMAVIGQQCRNPFRARELTEDHH